MQQNLWALFSMTYLTLNPPGDWGASVSPSLLVSKVNPLLVKIFGETSVLQKFLFERVELAVEKIVGLMNEANETVGGRFGGVKISHISLMRLASPILTPTSSTSQKSRTVLE